MSDIDDLIEALTGLKERLLETREEYSQHYQEALDHEIQGINEGLDTLYIARDILKYYQQ